MAVRSAISWAGALLVGATLLVGLWWETPARAAVDESVQVRASEHPDFGRIVFEWPRAIGAEASVDQGKLIVHFAEPFSGNVESIAQRLSNYVRSAKIGTDRRSIDIDLKQPMTLRRSGQGKLVILDLYPATATSAKSAKITPNARIPVKSAPTNLGAADATAATIVGAEPLKKSPVEPGNAHPEKDVGGASATAIAVTQASEPAPPTADAGPDRLATTVESTPGGTRLHLAFTRAMPAAVLQRGETLWLVFGRAAAVDLGGLAQDKDGAVIRAEQAAVPQGTLLQLRIKPGIAAVVSRRDAEWLVDLKDANAAVLPTAIEVRTEPAATLGPRVFLPVLDAGPKILLADPDGGEAIEVIPVLGPGLGVSLPRTFPQFSIVKSAQGVVVAPKTNQIVVQTLPTGIEITAKSGLLLSQNLPSQKHEPEARPLLFHFVQWRGAPGRFEATLQELQRALALAPELGRTAARYDLARFYFANGFNADALAVLTRLARQDPHAAEERGFRALRGAVELGLRRFDAAEADLGVPDLAQDPEAALWRGAVYVARKDWQRARDEFVHGRNAMADYPADVRAKLHLAMAHAFFGSGDAGSAKALLDVTAHELGRDEASLLLAGEAALLHGEVEAKLGDRNAAATDFGVAVTTANRSVRARAVLEQANLQLATGAIKASDAIDRLDGLRLSWRGDGLEPILLRRLGELNIAASDYRGGLTAWHQLLTYFGTSPLAPETRKDMDATFARLFLNGEADRLPAIEAVGLFYDFRDLAPSDARGDEMIRKLADRLVGVDLLDRAAELIEHQVTHRLSGDDKARVATRLAVIRLLDRKPDLALKALEASDKRPLPDTLVTERLHLQARALVDLARYDEAIKLLADDTSRDAVLLRIDIAWRQKNWPAAAQGLNTLLGDRDKGPATFEATERQSVLQLAVALSLAKDTAGLDRVRGLYAQKLAGSPEADAFRVLTNRVNKDDTEFRQLASSIASVNQLETFMSGYRAKLKKAQLSAIN